MLLALLRLIRRMMESSIIVHELTCSDRMLSHEIYLAALLCTPC